MTSPHALVMRLSQVLEARMSLVVSYWTTFACDSACYSGIEERLGDMVVYNLRPIGWSHMVVGFASL